MNEMIERVARAICNATTSIDPDTPLKEITKYYEIKGTTDPLWSVYVKAAYRAIEAMREPTEKMTGAGNAVFRTHDAPELWGDECWRTMIDEALKDD